MADERAPNVFPHSQQPGPLELAFVGDSVYDLYVRAHIALNGGKIQDLHKHAVSMVCARAQSEALARVENMLTQEEMGVARRARNARQSPTKNADAHDYHRATALEALIGYLYLTGRTRRMNELLSAAVGFGGETQDGDRPEQ